MALGLGNYSPKVKLKLFLISIVILLIFFQVMSGNVFLVLEFIFENIFYDKAGFLFCIFLYIVLYFSNLFVSKLFGDFLQRRENIKVQERYELYELAKKVRERNVMLELELEHNFKLAKIQLENDTAKMKMIKDLENEARNNKKADLEMINQMLNKLRGGWYGNFWI